MFASALPCVVYHLRSELDVRWLASCGRVYTTEVVTNYRLREYHATAETRDRESPRNESISNGFGVSRYFLHLCKTTVSYGRTAAPWYDRRLVIDVKSHKYDLTEKALYTVPPQRWALSSRTGHSCSDGTLPFLMLILCASHGPKNLAQTSQSHAHAPRTVLQYW